MVNVLDLSQKNLEYLKVDLQKVLKVLELAPNDEIVSLSNCNKYKKERKNKKKKISINEKKDLFYQLQKMVLVKKLLI